MFISYPIIYNCKSVFCLNGKGNDVGIHGRNMICGMTWDFRDWFALQVNCLPVQPYVSQANDCLVSHMSHGIISDSRNRLSSEHGVIDIFFARKSPISKLLPFIRDHPVSLINLDL